MDVFHNAWGHSAVHCGPSLQRDANLITGSTFAVVVAFISLCHRRSFFEKQRILTNT